MTDIPPEVAALPLGAIIIALVAWLVTLGLPQRYGGLAAIAIAVVLGTLVLVSSGQSWALALSKSLAWGLGIVSVHYSVVKPVVTPSTASPVPPASLVLPPRGKTSELA